MMYASTYRLSLALMLLALIALVGCSSSDPVSSNAQANLESTNPDEGLSNGIRDAVGDGGMEIEAMITRLNLATNSINLSEQTEPVLIDETTDIYLKQEVTRQGNAGSQSSDYLLVPATINDLNRGDTVRVVADPSGGQSIQAVSVTVEGEFSDPWFDVSFTDRLASIDTATFEVTFETNPFGGEVFVCAMLNDADGNWIWLQDFAVGELVDVAGRWEEDVFVIYQMVKVAE